MRHKSRTQPLTSSFESLEARQLLAAFVVDNLSDVVDGDYSQGQLTLREAVEQANANSEADTISFAQGLDGSIQLTGESLRITDELTITGPGSDVLSIRRDRAGLSDTYFVGDIFDVDDATDASFVVIIRNLSLRDAATAFRNSETLLLEGIVISNMVNGILNQSSGSLTIRDSVIEGNGAAFTRGAGIRNDGTLVVFTSAITDNLAFDGGGISNAQGASLLLDGSLVARNKAFNFSTDRPASVGSFGGGIENRGTANIRSSTISGNSVDNFAGRSPGSGVYNNGALTIHNSTIALNNGFVGLYHDGGTLLMVSSIVSENGYESSTRPPTSRIPSNIAGPGTIDSQSRNNLIGFGEVPAAFVHNVNGNLVGVNALLRPLAINGGPTRTHALVQGSPAIDAGLNPIDLETDQRGMDRTVGAATDIGAFEADPDSGYSLLARAGTVVATVADSANTHNVVSLTDDGTLVVFSQGWTAANLHRLTGAPAAIGEAAIWTDPADGSLNVMAIGEQGEFMLFERAASGEWTYRNLTNGGPVVLESQRITGVRAAAVFTTREPNALDRHVYVGFLVDTLTDDVAATELMYYAKASFNERANDIQVLIPEWAFTNLSTQFTDRGLDVPPLSNLISYVTPWNALHFAGVSFEGRIVSVWTAPSLNGQWRLSDLSNFADDAPTLDADSGLSVIQTSWRGINLTGIDTQGNISIVWWVPSFGGTWVASDLTDIVGGPALQPASLTGYGTSWNGMNYAGLDENGALYVYWWAPATNTWRADRLIDQVSNANTVPAVTGPLSSYASRGGTLNILGSAETGDVLRFSFQPGSPLWLAENLTDIATRM